MRRWVILMTLLVMVVASIAGWQEITYRGEEGQTKVLWHQLTGTNDLSSHAECIEKREYGMDIDKCVEFRRRSTRPSGDSVGDLLT
jgi:hypothetical protein